MSIPLPGTPVRGSKTGKPIMALFDLLGRPWALGIIWFLSKKPSTFKQIQHYCENNSPTLLSTRLKELQVTGLIEKTIDGYALTANGRSLFNVIEPMGAWSLHWAASLTKEMT